MDRAAGRSSGSCCSTRGSASTPPAEQPITTMSRFLVGAGLALIVTPAVMDATHMPPMDYLRDRHCRRPQSPMCTRAAPRAPAPHLSRWGLRRHGGVDGARLATVPGMRRVIVITGGTAGVG